MLTANVLELYAYNRWANAETIASCRGLPDNQLYAPLKASYSSVFGTLRHILWGEWLWLRRWQSPAPLPVPDPSTIDTLPALEQCWAEFEARQSAFLRDLRDADLDCTITYENPPGTRWTYSLHHMLQHVANHSTYHRGQVATLLRQLGVQPRSTDFLIFFDLGLGAGA